MFQVADISYVANTDPFAAWFVVTGDAKPDGIRVVRSVFGGDTIGPELDHFLRLEPGTGHVTPVFRGWRYPVPWRCSSGRAEGGREREREGGRDRERKGSRTGAPRS